SLLPRRVQGPRRDNPASSPAIPSRRADAQPFAAVDEKCREPNQLTFRSLNQRRLPSSAVVQLLRRQVRVFAVEFETFMSSTPKGDSYKPGHTVSSRRCGV